MQSRNKNDKIARNRSSRYSFKRYAVCYVRHEENVNTLEMPHQISVTVSCFNFKEVTTVTKPLTQNIVLEYDLITAEDLNHQSRKVMALFITSRFNAVLRHTHFHAQWRSRESL